MEFTHTYRNRRCKDIKCFITDPCESVKKLIEQNANFHVIVTNENGVDVYLKYSELRIIS
jgi:hypothetical protein